jgi:hypothetical protein
VGGPFVKRQTLEARVTQAHLAIVFHGIEFCASAFKGYASVRMTLKNRGSESRTGYARGRN